MRHGRCRERPGRERPRTWRAPSGGPPTRHTASPKCELPDRHVRPGARSAKPSVSPSRAEPRPRGERQPARAAGGPSPRHPVWLCRHRWIVAGHTPHGRRTPGPAAATRRPRSALSRAARAGWSLDHPLEDLVIKDDGSRGSTSRCPVTVVSGMKTAWLCLWIPFPIDMIHRTMT